MNPEQSFFSDVSEIFVIADTHLRNGRTDRMPPEVWQLAERADLVLHAGDVTENEVIDRLAELAPTITVLGNNDPALRHVLPETIEIDVSPTATRRPSVTIAMIHDSGPKKGRAARMHRRFPDADVVVFGHSHIPWHDDTDHGQLLFNPGSAVQRRRQPHCTIGWITLEPPDDEPAPPSSTITACHLIVGATT